MILRLVLRELKNQKQFTSFFLLNLFVGLIGLTSVFIFKASIESSLLIRSKQIQGSDIKISGRRDLSPDEAAKVATLLAKTEHRVAKTLSFYSMVPGKRIRLVRFQSADDQFPFYGKYTVQDSQGKVFQSQYPPKGELWTFPELLQQMDLELGSEIQLGQTRLTLTGLILKDPSAAIGLDMAPKAVINYSDIAATQLVVKGSVANFGSHYYFPQLNSSQTEKITEDIFQVISDPGLRVSHHKNASEQLSRILGRVNDFLALIAVVALLLSAVGTHFLYRNYIARRAKSMAIELVLGATHQQVFWQYTIQVALLGLAASTLALLCALPMSNLLEWLASDILKFKLQLQIGPLDLLPIFIIGPLGGILICLPILRKIIDIRPQILLQQNFDSLEKTQTHRWSYIPVIVFFWLLSCFAATSLQIGSLFFAVFLLSGFLIYLATRLLKTFTERKEINSLLPRLIVRNTTQNFLATASCILSFGLCCLLVNLIPQIEKSLQQELKNPQTSKLPGLFMFDIQEEQLEDLKKLAETSDVILDQISPMVRARLSSVNGKEFDKGEGAYAKAATREEQAKMRFRNRGFNLTYSNKMKESESIVAGEPIQADSEQAQISLEYRFAKRLDLKIGDELEFDIESVPVKGKVVNFRRIEWTSFRPNFFVKFNEGHLEEAPKVFLATTPQLSEQQKLSLQNRIVDSLPNVSIIDVSRLVERLSKLLETVAFALNFMSILCLIAGLFVIYSISNHQVASSKNQIGLLLLSGAPEKFVQKVFGVQFITLSAFGGLLGSALALAVGPILSVFVLESPVVWELPGIIITNLVQLGLVLIVVSSGLREGQLTDPKELILTE